MNEVIVYVLSTALLSGSICYLIGFNSSVLAIKFGDVKGYIKRGGIWEFHKDGELYRSKVYKDKIHWIRDSGTHSSEDDSKMFSRMVMQYENGLPDPWHRKE